MTDEFEPSEQTRKRIGMPARAALVVFAGYCLATVVRERSSGRSTASAIGLIGFTSLAGVTVAVLGTLCMRSVNKRLATEDAGALFTCRSNLWVDQVSRAPEISTAAERVRRRWVRFWFKGQVFGTIRLGEGTIRWTPERLTRRLRMQAWSLPLDRITSIEVSSMPIGIGRGGVVVLHLASGHLIDLSISDRDRFKAAWTQATRAAGPSPTVPH